MTRRRLIRYLASCIGKAFVGFNLPPKLPENPAFRQLILEISKMELTPDLIEGGMGRKKTDQEMLLHSQTIMATKHDEWIAAAGELGGAFSVGRRIRRCILC